MESRHRQHVYYSQGLKGLHARLGKIIHVSDPQGLGKPARGRAPGEFLNLVPTPDCASPPPSACHGHSGQTSPDLCPSNDAAGGRSLGSVKSPRNLGAVKRSQVQPQLVGKTLLKGIVAPKLQARGVLNNSRSLGPVPAFAAAGHIQLGHSWNRSDACYH